MHIPSSAGPAVDPATPHTLTHYTIRDGSGERMTPGCTCGWSSPRCEHADFERHLRRVAGL